MIRTFALVLTLFSATLCSAQNSTYTPRGELGLLWKISGNGLSKPSYLFGTMHVSQKLAFHLGEPWFNALDSVDVLATESNPETWLADLINSDLISGSVSLGASMGNYGTNLFDKKKFELGKDRYHVIVSLLRDEPDLVNSIMYRFSSYGGNFEEDSWLDMYIYQTGKKLGLEATGLETFDESMEATEKAFTPDEESEELSMRKYSAGYDTYEKIEAAYRSGNLDLLDSLTRKSSSKNFIKWLLVYRNEKFLSKIDSIVKKKSLFAAVGAAHLPGEMGLINLLRQKGYTLTPVAMGERDAERRNQIDSVIQQVPFITQYSSDSLFSYKAPAKMLEMFSIGSFKSDIGTELINGAYYSIARIKTYSGILNEKQTETFRLIDSLLYDNIPGKIISQKKIKVQDYDAVDITSKTRKGHTMRVRVVVLPEEVLILKVSAPDERANTFLGDTFFSSLQVRPPSSTNWQRFTIADNRFSISMPQKPVFYGANKLSALLSKDDVIAYDSKTKNCYLAMLLHIPEPSIFEEDTFELRQMAKSFAKANNYTEKKSSFVTYKGRKALKASYTLKDGRYCDALYVMQNLNYYAFAVLYEKTSPDTEKFFESIEFGLPKYVEFFDVTDTVVNFTGKTAHLPKSSVSRAMSNLWTKRNHYNSSDNTGTYSEYKTYTDREGLESVKVEVFRNSSYFQQKSEEHFIKLAKNYSSSGGNWEIKNEVTQKMKDGLQMDFWVTDTGSSKVMKVRIVLTNAAKYTLSSFIDPLLGESNFVKTFFESFSPIDSLTGGSVFANKSEVYFADLYSTDTTKVRQAENSIWRMRFEPSDKDKLLKLVASVPSSVSNPIQFKTALLSKFYKMKDDNVISFLKAQYLVAGDTSDYQFSILESLIGMETEQGFAAAKELLLMEAPLAGNDYSASTLFRYMRDSLQLSAKLFPDFFDLLAYDEYKPEVYSLLAELVDSGYISPDVYKSKLNLISIAAKNELKRILSNISDDNNDDDYYGDSYYSNQELYSYNSLLFPFLDQPHIKSHFDKIFSSDNKNLKLDVMQFFLSKKKTVDVNFLNTLASDDEYRITVYNTLNDINRLDLFPADQKKMDLFARSLAKQQYASGKDSLELVTKRYMQYRGEKGYVYFYKRTSSKEEDDEENNNKILPVGPMYEGDKMTTHNQMYTYEGNYNYSFIKEEETTQAEKIDKLMDKNLATLRKISAYNTNVLDSNDEEYQYKYEDESYD